ncbi:MAG: helix-turn-helix domain-containing protein [Verrucomicrobiota bacterium]
MPDTFNVERFLSQVDWRLLARELSDALTDQAFFMKDRQGRFVMQNRRALEYCQAANEQETTGKTDADFWSPERAIRYVEGDQLVMRSGRAIINQLEAAPEEAGSDNMIIYSKFPVYAEDGQIIGVAGVHQVFDTQKVEGTCFGPLFKAIRRIQEQFDTHLKISDLAKLSGLSHSQFVRRFHQILGMSPKDYLQRVRVRRACRLLETSDSTVASVAHQCGFYDHSHFSHVFRRQTGLSPSRYRSEHVR